MARRSNTYTAPKFSAEEYRNWGFWDGKADAERGKVAEWMTKGPHFNPDYEAGYRAGLSGQPHPNTGEAA